MKSRQSHRKGARLGQHFLTNAGVAARIAEAANVTDGDTVIEVGPGKGMLTKALLKTNARVIAIEKDPAMVEILKQEFTREIKNKTLVLHEQDIRDFLEPSTCNLPLSYTVAANIPYYITGELIRLFLTAKHQPEKIVFLVQKEVAERIVGRKPARGGSASGGKESILSLSVKVFGKPRYVGTVKRGNFSPPPSVDSAILAIDNISRKNILPIYGKNMKVKEEWFFKVVKAGFAQKRKTLAGNLKRVFGEKAVLAMKNLALPEKIRAEDVHLPQWLALTKSIMT